MTVAGNKQYKNCPIKKYTKIFHFAYFNFHHKTFDQRQLLYLQGDLTHSLNQMEKALMSLRARAPGHHDYNDIPVDSLPLESMH